MANVAVTNTFTGGTTIISSQVNTNFSDIVTWLNNHNGGTDPWGQVQISATVGNPLGIISSASTTELSIDNTATDGDPLITFKLSGVTKYTIGVDDSDTDYLKIGTTSLTSNTSIVISGSDVFVVGLLKISDGSESAPTLTFNADLDCGLFRPGNNEVGITVGGTMKLDISAVNTSIFTNFYPGTTNTYSCGILANVWAAVYSTLTRVGNGSEATPSMSFFNDNDTGWFGAADNSMRLSLAGTQRYLFDTASFNPVTDNVISCGKSGSRWSAVWAANGTIQTSCSETKINVQNVTDDKVKIPQAVTFNRITDTHTKPQLGFLADDLPEECFAVDDNGIRSTTDVYTSSVIGILCSAVKKLTDRITALEGN